MTATKGFIHGAATAALDTRKADVHKIVANAAGTPRLGLLTDDPNIVIADASTTPMRVAVKACGIVTQRQAGDGVAIWSNDGSIFVNLSAAPLSNSRIDVIYAKHNDTSHGDANNTPTIGVTEGSAAPSPTKPAIPSGALELATVTIPAGATATTSGGVVIANTYAMTAMRGGSVALRSSAEQTAWAPADGAIAYRLDTDDLLARINGAWEAIGGDDTGWVTVTPESAFYNVVALGDDRALAVRRIGKMVRIEGHISTDGATSTYSVWAFIPAGFRPSKNAWVSARLDGTGSTAHGAFVAPDGDLTFATAATGAQSFMVYGAYFID
jgi:hypothetical protein